MIHLPHKVIRCYQMQLDSLPCKIINQLGNHPYHNRHQHHHRFQHYNRPFLNLIIKLNLNQIKPGYWKPCASPKLQPSQPNFSTSPSKYYSVISYCAITAFSMVIILRLLAMLFCCWGILGGFWPQAEIQGIRLGRRRRFRGLLIIETNRFKKPIQT